MNINSAYSEYNDRDSNGWPLVVHNDDGIRPAGEPDECFYCHQEVGNPHAQDCVTVTKKVRVLYTIEAVIDVPHSWEADQVVDSETDGGWEYNVAEWGSAEFVNVTTAYVGTENDCPQRKLKSEQE